MIADEDEVWVSPDMQGSVGTRGQRVTVGEYLSRGGEGRA